VHSSAGPLAGLLRLQRSPLARSPAQAPCRMVGMRSGNSEKVRNTVEEFEYLLRHDSLATARALYKAAAPNHRERLVMPRDRARVIVRSDRPKTMPR
jgi:hypothetical protein